MTEPQGPFTSQEYEPLIRFALTKEAPPAICAGILRALEAHDQLEGELRARGTCGCDYGDGSPIHSPSCADAQRAVRDGLMCCAHCGADCEDIMTCPKCGEVKWRKALPAEQFHKSASPADGLDREILEVLKARWDEHTQETKWSACPFCDADLEEYEAHGRGCLWVLLDDLTERLRDGPGATNER